MNLRYRHFALYILSVLGLFMSEDLSAQGQSTTTQYLTGTDNEHTVAWDFYCTAGRNSGAWTTIDVPSCWEQQGFGNYDYGRDYRTYGKRFNFADEKGIYRHEFEVDEKWKGSHVNLVFEGVMTDATVSINGQSAGPTHQGGFYEFKYDVSEMLRYGAKNTIEVTVSKMSENKSVNRAERYADYWIFGGIFRPVYLEIKPKEHIDRVAIAAGADGTFAVDVFTEHIEGARTLKVDIFDHDDQLVGSTSSAISSSQTPIRLVTTVDNPQLWTNESPHLYRAAFQLIDEQTTIHRTEEVFGFRTIEIRRGDGVYINGQKIKFKGVSRHAFWPETGRSMNREIDRLDIQLMKEMNMNAVRCTSYPQDKSFYTLCDSLGLFVLDELGGWQNAYDTEIGEKLVKEMVIRDVNHPSIIFWVNGNEGGTNDELADDYHLYDPSARPVIKAHHKPGNSYNGIDPNHYEKYYSAKSILEDSLIYMPTEFLHAQDDGGGAAGLDDFWDMFLKAPKSAGGFIWALLDEGIVRTDLNGTIDVNRVNAPDGVLGPHRQKEGSFYAMREIFSPVVFPDDALPADFAGTLQVENRFHFTNLKDCRFRIQLVDFTGPAKRSAAHTVKWESTTMGPDILPSAAGRMALNLPADWKEYDGLYIKAFAPNGEEVITRSWPITTAKEWKDIMRTKLPEDTTTVRCVVTDSTVVLTGASVQASFDKNTGRLIQVLDDLGLDPQFGNGPVLVGGDAAPISHEVARDGRSYVYEVKYQGDLDFVRWTMQPDGLLRLDYKYHIREEHPFAGVTFDCPESHIIGVEWLGNGPYRVWKNRMKGGNLDVWRASYNNTHTGSSPWIYPEFKGYYSDVSWMVFNTAEGRFLVGSDEEMFVRLFDFHALSAPQPHPELPSGDVSFLDNIPPIGTKLATGMDVIPGELGPQSEWNKMTNPTVRTLYFRFGL